MMREFLVFLARCLGFSDQEINDGLPLDFTGDCREGSPRFSQSTRNLFIKLNVLVWQMANKPKEGRPARRAPKYENKTDEELFADLVYGGFSKDLSKIIHASDDTYGSCPFYYAHEVKVRNSSPVNQLLSDKVKKRFDEDRFVQYLPSKPELYYIVDD